MKGVARKDPVAPSFVLDVLGILPKTIRAIVKMPKSKVTHHKGMATITLQIQHA